MTAGMTVYGAVELLQQGATPLLPPPMKYMYKREGEGGLGRESGVWLERERDGEGWGEYLQVLETKTSGRERRGL